MPTGLPFVVDGSACTTPCILLNKPTGAQVQVAAPASVSPDPSRRYDFRTWNGGNTSSTFSVTITDSAQVFVATYQAFYKLTVSSSPANHVGFTFFPASGGGFYTDGTSVSVTAAPNNGFTFLHWSGDLSGTSLTASTIMNTPRSAVAVLDGYPFISENGVKNSAGDTPSPTVGPGSDISIFGDNLADTLTVAPAGPVVASHRRRTWVTLNGRLLALPFHFASADQRAAFLRSERWHLHSDGPSHHPAGRQPGFHRATRLAGAVPMVSAAG